MLYSDYVQLLLLLATSHCSAFQSPQPSPRLQVVPNTEIHSTKVAKYSEGRLYRVQLDREPVIDSHIAVLKRVSPEIAPDPLVLDEVQEYYPTQYETFCFFPKDREEITISIRKTSFGCGKLGSWLWRAGLALSCYLVSILDEYDETRLKSMRVLELGAGLGLASCVCREVGVGKVLATDFWEERRSFDKPRDKERLIPHQLFGLNLDFNVVKCAGIEGQRLDADSISVGKLDWGSEIEAFRTKMIYDPTLIVGSDIVYRAEDAPPLIRTLELLMGGESSNETPVDTILFLDYNGRNDDDVNAFRVMIKDMVDSYAGWILSEEELKLCYWMDETGKSFQEDYGILEIRISNGKLDDGSRIPCSS